MTDERPDVPPEGAEPARPMTGMERLRHSFLRPSRGQGVVAVLVALVAFAAVTQVRTSGQDDDYASLRDADLVLSVNSAHDAAAALANAAPALRPGTVWADLNTASPGAKAALADAARENGLAF